MISSATFHVITTELVVGSFAMAGICFLVLAIQSFGLFESEKASQISDNAGHFALGFGLLATPFAVFSGISSSPTSDLSSPLLVNKMFLSMTGLGLGLAALISRWKMGSSILVERKPMLIQTFTGMAASGLMLLTASAGGSFARGESLLDIFSLPYDMVILMPIAISVILLISGLATTASALWKLLARSTV